MNYKDALQNPIFKIISEASKNLNLDSYVIGGFVRDYLLQRGDAKDIDIVAVGSGIELARAVAKLLPKGIGKLQTPLYSGIGGWVILSAAVMANTQGICVIFCSC